jgi:hypothetical protein
MYKFGKCPNCGKKVTQEDIENKKGFLIKEDQAICEKCYFIYFTRVKEYLYNHPQANMDELVKGTKLPLSLIQIYYAEGAIEQVIQEINNMNQEAIEDNNREKERLRKLQLARSLQGGISHANKVVDSRPMMRYFREDNTKRR